MVALFLAMASLVVKFAATLEALFLFPLIASLGLAVTLVVVVLSAGGETLFSFVLVAFLFDTLA